MTKTEKHRLKEGYTFREFFIEFGESEERWYNVHYVKNSGDPLRDGLHLNHNNSTLAKGNKEDWEMIKNIISAHLGIRKKEL